MNTDEDIMKLIQRIFEKSSPWEIPFDLMLFSSPITREEKNVYFLEIVIKNGMYITKNTLK